MVVRREVDAVLRVDRCRLGRAVLTEALRLAQRERCERLVAASGGAAIPTIRA
jgi:hypothetical protein